MVTFGLLICIIFKKYFPTIQDNKSIDLDAFCQWLGLVLRKGQLWLAPTHFRLETICLRSNLKSKLWFQRNGGCIVVAIAKSVIQLLDGGLGGLGGAGGSVGYREPVV